jgi:acyl carrier protein
MEELNELYKIIQPDFLIKAISDTTGFTNFDIREELDFLDDLDYIEIIMSIEKEYYISISDDAFEKIEKIDLMLFIQILHQLKEMNI